MQYLKQNVKKILKKFIWKNTKIIKEQLNNSLSFNIIKSEKI